MEPEVYEDQLDWECGTLEAAPVESASPPYPYPGLRPTGRAQPTSLRVAVLENDLLQATFARDLGSRLLQLLDKRTGIRSLAIPSVLNPAPGGPRGARLAAGLQWTTGRADRPAAMGPADLRPEPAEEEGDPAGLLHFELEAGSDLGLLVRWRLAPDRAALQADVRIANRGLAWTPYAGGFRVAQVGAEVVWLEDGVAVWHPASDAGYAVLWPAGTFAAAADETSELVLFRRPEGEAGLLAPLETDSFSLLIVPFSGIGRPSAVDDRAAVGVSSDALRVQAVRADEGPRMFLLTRDGQTLEAPGPAEPGPAAVVPLSGSLADPAGFRWRGSDGEDRLAWPHGAAALPAPDPAAAPPAPARTRTDAWTRAMVELFADGDPGAALRQAEAEPALRGPARVIEALAALRRSDPAAAAAALDDALLRLGDDPLVWWLRAVASRRAGHVEEHAERPDLLNAHFLNPLEPALRAEGFLAQSPMQGREPNALVRPLAGHPDALADVACRLLDAGLRDDAARWIDEALRHGEAPMLRYLLAASLLEASRMRTEAAQHVAAAAQAAWEPPFPWRHAEVRAVQTLHAAFPHDARLARLAALLA